MSEPKQPHFETLQLHAGYVHTDLSMDLSYHSLALTFLSQVMNQIPRPIRERYPSMQPQ